MLKKLCMLTVLMTTLSLNVGCAYSSQNSPSMSESNARAGSIEGQMWSGTDSDGDFYEFYFLKGGQLRYSSRGPGQDVGTMYEDEGDVWAQNGNVVIMTINNYSSYVGLKEEGRITGDAWNVAGRRWTWDVKRQSN